MSPHVHFEEYLPVNFEFLSTYLAVWATNSIKRGYLHFTNSRSLRSGGLLQSILNPPSCSMLHIICLQIPNAILSERKDKLEGPRYVLESMA